MTLSDEAGVPGDSTTRRGLDLSTSADHCVGKMRTNIESVATLEVKMYWRGKKSLPHRVFPGGPPSKYYPGPTMLNFRDQTRTGVFIVVWS